MPLMCSSGLNRCQLGMAAQHNIISLAKNVLTLCASVVCIKKGKNL